MAWDASVLQRGYKWRLRAVRTILYNRAKDTSCELTVISCRVSHSQGSRLLCYDIAKCTEPVTYIPKPKE